MPLIRRTLGKREVNSDGEISVVMGHISLKDSRLGCIKAVLHKRREKECGGGAGVLGSPYTGQGCSKSHVDEGQEDSIWLRQAHEPSAIQKTVFKKNEPYWEDVLGCHPEGNFKKKFKSTRKCDMSAYYDYSTFIIHCTLGAWLMWTP